MLLDAKGNPIKSRSQKFIEVATRNAAQGEFLSTLDQLPNPSKILEDVGETIEVFDKIARQIDVEAAINDYRSGIASMDYTVSSGEENSKRAEFFTEYIESIKLFEFIEDVLSARDYGYAVLEVKHYKTFNGYIVPAEFSLKPQKWFGFDNSANLRFYSKENPAPGVDIFKEHPNKFILSRYRHSDLNPYGRGLLDTAYWYAVGLNGNFEFMMTFLEQDGTDKWVVRHPRNASSTEITNALNAAYNLRNNGVAAIPEGNEFEKKDVPGRSSSTDAYKTGDELMTRKIMKLWFGTDLLMQTEGKGGYSSSQTGTEIRGEALSSGKNIVSDAVSQVFRICQNLNNLPGSDDEIIKFNLYHEDDNTLEDAQRDAEYMEKGGFRPTKQFYINRGYQEDEFELAEPTEPQSADFAESAPDSLVSAYENLRARLVKKKP